MNKLRAFEDLSQLLSAKDEDQLAWLKHTSLAEANDAKEDIDLFLQVKAFEVPLGCIFYFDQSSFDDMVQYPEAYDLGWELQKHIPSMTDARAEEVNNGAALTEAEIEQTKGIVNSSQDESYDGTNCSGFRVSFGNSETCFAAFAGPSEGQGGIDYQFYRLFKDEKSAIEHFSKLGDRWWDF
ncbi:hypothetical protein N9D77_08925 [Paracoccaceae bacterium]|jgi:hypothetical protein|nr:hypothetical protein [Paracoccaceae bacterium]